MPETCKRLSNPEFNALRDYIYKKSGILFTEKNRYQLESKIKERFERAGCVNASEYLKRFEDYKCGAAELNELFNAVTINETSFFRDKSFIAALEKNVIPELIKKYDLPGCRQLNIWSAASSSGEEAYTIAIMLSEHLRDAISKWRIRIHATDLDDNVLKKCREGKYNGAALRDINIGMKDRYFDRLDSDTFLVKPGLKALVQPEKCNLIDAAACGKLSRMDLILIRNVLIYFDAASKKKVLKTCYENLKNGGYMFLGHSETILGLNNNFKTVNFANAVGYKK